jgi:hypothetical protein
MLVLVDIDGTIARRNLPIFCHLCNYIFDLNLPDERIDSIHSYQEWLEQPEMVNLREQMGAPSFQKALDQIGLAPTHLEALLPIDDAIHGVRYLAKSSGNLRYCTARKCILSQEAPDECYSRSIELATYRWLQAYNFPGFNQVFFCSSPREKLYYMAEQIEHGETQVMLIDDHYRYLLDAAQTLPGSMQALLRDACTLIAFRAEQVETSAAPFQKVLALPAWNALETVLKNSVISPCS